MDSTPLSRVFPDFFEVGTSNPVFIAHTKNCLPLTLVRPQVWRQRSLLSDCNSAEIQNQDLMII